MVVERGSSGAAREQVNHNAGSSTDNDTADARGLSAPSPEKLHTTGDMRSRAPNIAILVALLRGAVR